MLGRRQFLTGLAVAGSAATTIATARAHQTQRQASARSTRGQTLTAQDLEDALVGSSYLGCGGGGSLAEARQLIAADLAAGSVFRKLPVDALADDDRVACPYALASLAPMSDALAQRLDAMGTERVDAPVQEAFAALEKHVGTPFSGVILGEIGPLSLAEGLSTAARLGVAALDADTVGRATPEINQHTVRVAGYPLTPAAGVTPFGDVLVLTHLKDPSRQEDVFRSLAVVSGLVGVADAPITGAQAKTPGTLVTGSLSLAMRIGRAVRTARHRGENGIEAARQAGDGYLLFEGKVAEAPWRDEDGFLVGRLTINGEQRFAGRTMVTDYKNEHLVARIGERVVATCPDLITVVDKASGEGINNPDFAPGQDVTVLGFRCDPVWRTQAGLAVFSPRYFGFPIDYIPIEDRIA
ncbi:MAG: DUF917 domain-containing protein [Pseudomonadota bacterium]